VPIPRIYRSRRQSALDDATRRLAAIHAEIDSILAMFPDLRYVARVRRSGGTRIIRPASGKARQPFN
jgi:hypothetical protein